MDINAQILDYAEKLKSPEITPRIKKRILQKLGKLKKQLADGPDAGSVEQGAEESDDDKQLPKKMKVDPSSLLKEKTNTNSSKAASTNDHQVTKKERKTLLHLLNKDLASFAVKKQADKAKLAVKQFQKKGQQLDTLAYSNLINVFVRCNEINRVTGLMQEMKQLGVKPNIITYTTVLKGYAENGMMSEASSLFREMVQSKDFNVRTVTTFLRGCIRSGMVGSALYAYQSLQSARKDAAALVAASTEDLNENFVEMDDGDDVAEDDLLQMDVTQESACLEYLVKMLCQAGRIHEAASLIQAHIEQQSGGKERSGMSESSAVANAGLYTLLARASLLFGQWAPAGKYITLARELLEIEDKANLTQAMKRKFAEAMDDDEEALPDEWQQSQLGPTTSKSVRLFRQHRRSELRQLLDTMDDYLTTLPRENNTFMTSAATANAFITDEITSLLLPTTTPAERGKCLRSLVAIAAYHSLVSKVLNFGVNGHCDLEETNDPRIIEGATTASNTIALQLFAAQSTKFGLGGSSVADMAADQLLALLKGGTSSGIDDSGSEDEGEFDTAEERGSVSKEALNKLHLRSKELVNHLETFSKSQLLQSITQPTSTHLAPQVNLRRLFHREDDIEELIAAGVRSSVPIKLEIGAGNGDWVVAQAEADRIIDRNNHTSHGQQTSVNVTGQWLALELRCDRVYNILANHLLAMRPMTYLAHHLPQQQQAQQQPQRALQQLLDDIYYANNLGILGGDASDIVQRRIPRNSIAEVYINYPQPPERITGSGKQGNRNQGKHLLTQEFFQQLILILREDGSLTLLTDNLLYAQNLAQSLVELAQHSSAKKALLVDAVADVIKGESDSDGAWKVQEQLPVVVRKEGEEIKRSITIWRGEPGRAAGHVADASSYFDRMWSMGQKKRRWFLFLRKQVVQTTSTTALTETVAHAVNPVSTIKKTVNDETLDDEY